MTHAAHTPFDLSCDPFSETHDPRFFFESPIHVRVLEGLRKAINENATLTIVVGADGTGKTLLARRIEKRFDPAWQAVHIDGRQDNPQGLTRKIAAQLRVALPAECGGVEEPTNLLEALRRSSVTRRRVIAIVDGAEHLTPPAIAELETLCAEKLGTHPPLQCVLIGRSPVERRVNDSPVLRKCARRLEPLGYFGPREVAAYVKHRWAAAGGGGGEPFDTQTLDVIARCSGGNLRGVNQICTALMAWARRAGVDHIDAAFLESMGIKDKTLTALARSSRRDALSEVGSPTMADTSPESTTISKPIVPDRTRATDRASAEKTLGRFAEGSQKLDEQYGAIGDRISRLDDICKRADLVRERLTEFVDRLAEIGETSEERIGLLLESLDAATEARKNLQALTGETAEQIDRFESAALEHAGRIEASTTSQIRRLDESAISSAERIKRESNDQVQTFVDQTQRLRREIEEIRETQAAHSRKRERHLDERAAQFGEQAEAEFKRFSKLVADEHARLQEIFEARTAEARRQEATVREHNARLSESAESREQKLEQTMRDHLHNQRAAEDAAVDRLNSVVEACAKRVEEGCQAQLETFKTEVEALIAPLRPDGEFSTQLAERVQACIREVGDFSQQRIEDVRQTAGNMSAELKALTEDKGSHLSRQLQEAQKAVEQINEATRGGRAILGEIQQSRNIAKTQIEELGATCERALSAETQLTELHARVEPTVGTIRECIEGSDATIAKIEGLIQDVWTLNTTTQSRAASLKKRCAEAETVQERVQSTQREAETFAATLASQNGNARRMVDELAGVIKRSNETMQRIDVACKSAADAQTATSDMVDSADRMHTSLMGAVDSGNELMKRLDNASSSSRLACDRIEGKKQAAEQCVAKLDAKEKTYRTLHEQIESDVQSGKKLSAEFEETLATGRDIQEQLQNTTASAHDVLREASQLLATLVERRDILEAGDASLNEFLDHMKDIRNQLQQLQTRTDAFRHQLDGMLADPHKIIEEAKQQSAQFDQVCRAVRKVFAGLSQASLQANRDITRFSRISREANDKLEQLTNETQKAGQTLREWVDEAAHVQSRLAKSIAQVPPLTQSHPRKSLEDLADASARSVADILKSSMPRRDDIRPAPSPATERSSVAKERLEPTTDFSELIRQSETVAAGRE